MGKPDVTVPPIDHLTIRRYVCFFALYSIKKSIPQTQPYFPHRSVTLFFQND